MTRQTNNHVPRASDDAPSADATSPDDTSSRVVARPDGFYWVADDGQQEFGPFASAADAMAALLGGIETGLEPGETLAEAESEIGYVEPPPLGDEPAQ
jgi:hypothetical protein